MEGDSPSGPRKGDLVDVGRDTTEGEEYGLAGERGELGQKSWTGLLGRVGCGLHRRKRGCLWRRWRVVMGEVNICRLGNICGLRGICGVGNIYGRRGICGLGNICGSRRWSNSGGAEKHPNHPESPRELSHHTTSNSWEHKQHLRN